MAPILAANATTTVSFDLPAQTLNLGQSKLNFNMGFAPLTLNAHALADPWTCFSRVYVSCRSGLILCDVNDVGNYSKMTSLVCTPNSEIQTRSGGIASYA